MYKLSPRLKKIAGLVPKFASVADIGADHGYLSIFIEKTKSPKKIIACDINEKPLSLAKKNIEKSGCERIETRLSDGLDEIDNDEIDTVIIAGLGGEVISGIIERAPWLKSGEYTLILQPMTAAVGLRRFLAENGFEIVYESAIKDAGKIYSVIKAQYTKVEEQQEEAFFYIGKLNPENETDAEYIKKQVKIAEECKNALFGIKQKEQKFEYYQKLTEQLKEFLGEN